MYVYHTYIYPLVGPSVGWLVGPQVPTALVKISRCTEKLSPGCFRLSIYRPSVCNSSVKIAKSIEKFFAKSSAINYESVL